MNFLSYALPFVGVLTLVVFIHEYGHYIVARKCGVTIDAFAVGMGPEICGFNDRHGTRWKLCWLPIGGYVKFADDENGASVPSRDKLQNMTAEQRTGALQTKSLAQKSAIVAAGPAFNIISATLIYIGTFWWFGTFGVEPVVDKLVPEGAALRAGLKAGDRITEIDGSAIQRFTDLQRIVGQSPGSPLLFTIVRDGVTQKVSITPTLGERTDPIGNKVQIGLIGVQAGKGVQEQHGIVDAIGLGFKETGFICKQIIMSLPRLPGAIAKVLMFQPQSELGGPIAIAEMTGEAAKTGPGTLLAWVAMFSIILGVMNLMPIPILDGGHLVFYALEAIRGKPLDARNQEIGFKIGMALLATMMFAAILGDFMRKFGFGVG